MSRLRHAILLAADAARGLPADARGEVRGPLLRLLRDAASGEAGDAALQTDADGLLGRIAEFTSRRPRGRPAD